jgi:hypothetical protein
MRNEIQALLIAGKQFKSASDAAWNHYRNCLNVLESVSRKDVGFLYDNLSQHVDQLWALLIG